MLKNIKITLAYEGTNYQGWQRGSTGKSIEEVLQNVLEKIYQHSICLQAASRTDAGVHAVGQVINFFTHKEYDLSQCFWSLNQLLPLDLRVLSVTEVSDTFHPSLDALSKEYRYYICHSPVQLPQNRHFSWHVYKKLDFSAMEEALQLLEGIHDFTSFCNHHVGNQYTDYVRNVISFKIHSLSDQRFFFAVRGNHFLYRMVRNLVGTAVDIGKGKIQIEEIPRILQQKDRRCAGLSAPAHGLFLHEIRYS